MPLNSPTNAGAFMSGVGKPGWNRSALSSCMNTCSLGSLSTARDIAKHGIRALQVSLPCSQARTEESLDTRNSSGACAIAAAFPSHDSVAFAIGRVSKSYLKKVEAQAPQACG